MVLVMVKIVFDLSNDQKSDQKIQKNYQILHSLWPYYSSWLIAIVTLRFFGPIQWFNVSAFHSSRGRFLKKWLTFSMFETLAKLRVTIVQKRNRPRKEHTPRWGFI